MTRDAVDLTSDAADRLIEDAQAVMLDLVDVVTGLRHVLVQPATKQTDTEQMQDVKEQHG